jgi:hypothetical protein
MRRVKQKKKAAEELTSPGQSSTVEYAGAE